jgi:hypothetical protein
MDVDAPNADRPPIDRRQRIDRADQCRFARARRSDQTARLPLHNVEGDALQNFDRTVGFMHIAKAHNRLIFVPLRDRGAVGHNQLSAPSLMRLQHIERNLKNEHMSLSKFGPSGIRPDGKPVQQKMREVKTALPGHDLLSDGFAKRRGVFEAMA